MSSVYSLATGGGGGGIASINGDTTSAQVIAGSGSISVNSTGGTTTISGGGGNAATPGLLSLSGTKYVRAFTGNMASGDNILYTAPAGKRAIINSVGVFNPTGGAITFYPIWRIGGVNYKYSGGLSCGANTANQVATSYVIILEPGEGVGLNTTALGLNGYFRIVEYDDSTAVYAAKKLSSWSSGNNTIYTVPASTSAVLIDNVGTVQQNVTSLNYFNSSGGTRTITWYYVESGGSPGTTNQVSPATSSTNDTRFASIQSTSFSAGDSVVLNTNSTADTQLAWVNVMETPA